MHKLKFFSIFSHLESPSSGWRVNWVATPFWHVFSFIGSSTPTVTASCPKPNSFHQKQMNFKQLTAPNSFWLPITNFFLHFLYVQCAMLTYNFKTNQRQTKFFLQLVAEASKFCNCVMFWLAKTLCYFIVLAQIKPTHTYFYTMREHTTQNQLM